MKPQIIKRTNDLLIRMAANCYNGDDKNVIENSNRKKDRYGVLSDALINSIKDENNLDNYNIRFYNLNGNPFHAVLVNEDNELMFDPLETARTNYDFDNSNVQYQIENFGNQVITLKNDEDTVSLPLKDFKNHYVDNIENVCINKNLKRSASLDNADSTLLHYIQEDNSHSNIELKIEIENDKMSQKEDQELTSFVDSLKTDKQSVDKKQRNKINKPK